MFHLLSIRNVSQKNLASHLSQIKDVAEDKHGWRSINGHKSSILMLACRVVVALHDNTSFKRMRKLAIMYKNDGL
jgi:hypothetical protein